MFSRHGSKNANTFHSQIKNESKRPLTKIWFSCKGQGHEISAHRYGPVLCRFNGADFILRRLMGEKLNYQKRESIISYGLRFIGQPYEWGGDGKKGRGFDCSGLIQELLWSVGALPDRTDRSAQALYELFKAKTGKPSCPHGNLVFFGKDLNSISHIGITVNEFQYLEAGGGDSKNISGMVRLRPKWSRKDLLCEIDILG